MFIYLRIRFTEIQKSTKCTTVAASNNITFVNYYTEVTFTDIVRYKWPSSVTKQELLLLATATICSDPYSTVRKY